MKFTLKDYQHDAFVDVRDRIDDALVKWQTQGVKTSFALTAPTGAGKTVIAAAVIESLFFGDDTVDFDEDPSAAVLWFSDSPSLNEQSRLRLMEASDRISPSDMVVIEPPFSQPTLEPGKVYFLNTQRLSKNSLLTRGHVDDAGQFDELRAAPDLQGHTIWQTIANTINDPELSLVMVLDEAHRGFDARTQRDKPTIVRRLVNGSDGNAQPPMPIVWGISATIDRFRTAMKESDALQERFALPDAVVDARRVQESGLVKDTVVLEIPDEAGDFDTVLLRRAARKLRESTTAWAKYAQAQGGKDPVKPLLVFQVPNRPDPDAVGQALDTIFDEYPDLDRGSVRHVLSDHKVESFGGWDVDYIDPERVQDAKSVRVLIAKDAISTGWDCPRAEVMVSFRPAKEKTHVHQLLGRLVRNPLARRVPGDEWLNSVECILPRFDRTVAAEVIRLITGKTNVEDSGPTVVLDGHDLVPNPAVGAAVWECWDTLPSMTIPQRGARPHVRLKSLALELSRDGVRPGAVAEAKRETVAILKGESVRHETALEKAVAEVLLVHGQAIAGSSREDKLSYSTFTERADYRSVRVEYEQAKRAFGGDFANELLDQLWDDSEDVDDGAAELEAMARLAGLSTIPRVRETYDREVERLSDEWFTEHRVALKQLPDERQAAYEEIRALSTEPKLTPLQRPRLRIGDFKTTDDLSQVVDAPVRELHLMANQAGDFPVTGLNPWEVAVVDTELGRDGVLGWYRNPPRQASDSLGISYRDQVKGDLHTMHPDFVFFHDVNGQAMPSIVDPHGHHLEDAVVKLAALGDFADKHGTAFHRIEAISRLGATMRVLDLKQDATRREIKRAVSEGLPAEVVYESDRAADYDAVV